ncbi:ENR1 protein, partial [Gymnorhina tibicen]|nr:ENR1 protein [Gymnorhina tibicen]
IEREKFYVCITSEPNPFCDEPQLSKLWNRDGINTVKHSGFWTAPKGLFWLWGKKAYVMLPKDWAGSCALGVIRPSFFLLPCIEGQHLGIPL